MFKFCRVITVAARRKKAPRVDLVARALPKHAFGMWEARLLNIQVSMMVNRMQLRSAAKARTFDRVKPIGESATLRAGLRGADGLDCGTIMYCMVLYELR